MGRASASDKTVHIKKKTSKSICSGYGNVCSIWLGENVRRTQAAGILLESEMERVRGILSTFI
jgi:hypothetical protein